VWFTKTLGETNNKVSQIWNFNIGFVGCNFEEQGDRTIDINPKGWCSKHYKDFVNQTSIRVYTIHIIYNRRWKKITTGKSIVKGAIEVSEHSSKLHFYMFEKSQGKHDSLDCHKSLWNIFH